MSFLCGRVWSLQVPLKKKFRISILLGAGGIATGASVVRLILVFQPNSFTDETVSFVRFNLLGYVPPFPYPSPSLINFSSY
jgi:hypothetical protein